MTSGAEERTHCDRCGTPLPPPPAAGNWGTWKCPDRNCGTPYCQDCGSRVSDISGVCLAYEEDAARRAEDDQHGGNQP